jgi:hypothetical protein
MAVTVPVRRKRKMREGESRARPWCATERRVWGGSGRGSRSWGSRHGGGGPGERCTSGPAEKGNGHAWARWMIGCWAGCFGPDLMNSTIFYLFDFF